MVPIILDDTKDTFLTSLGVSSEREDVILDEMGLRMTEIMEEGKAREWGVINSRDVINKMLAIAQTYEEAIGIMFKLGSRLKEMSILSELYGGGILPEHAQDDALKEAMEILKGKK